MSTVRLLAMLVLLGTLSVVGSRAQDNPVLPDLTPREVEIRGELTIRFPSLRRQPLVGFNPPPRIPEIPADRRPFAEAYKQDRADLPLSPLRAPAAPAVSPYFDGPVFTGHLEGGAGRYLERFVLADFASRPGTRSSWTAQGTYRGRSGFEPYPDAAAEYDQGSLLLDGSVPVGSFRLGAAVDGRMSRYSLYGTVPASGSQSLETPVRDVRGGSVGAFLARERGAVRMRLEGSIGTSSVETDAFDPAVRIDPRIEGQDAMLAFAGRIESVGRTLNPFASATYAATTLEGSPFPSVRSYRAGGGIRFDLGTAARLTTGLHVLGSDREESSSDRSFDYVSPEIRLDASPVANVRVSLVQEPRTERIRLLDLYGQQPFLVDSPTLEAEIWPIDALARAVAAVGRVEVSVGAGFRQSPNRRFFQHDPTTFLDYARGISSVGHGKAREYDASVDVTGYVGASIQAGIGATVRKGRLTDLDVDLPYFAPWTIRSLVSAAMFEGRGLIQLTTRVEGPRYRDLEQSLELPAFADLDLLASYRVTPQASVVLRLENIGGNRPEWDRYLRPPAVFTAGLAWEW